MKREYAGSETRTCEQRGTQSLAVGMVQPLAPEGGLLTGQKGVGRPARTAQTQIPPYCVGVWEEA